MIPNWIFYGLGLMVVVNFGAQIWEINSKSTTSTVQVEKAPVPKTEIKYDTSK